MNAHTPGTWKVSGWREGPPYNRTVPSVVAGAATIATMHVAPITPQPEAEANARLIAAAPDMLEVLQTVESDAGQVPPWLWDRIQAVIAKATGEATP